jgi:hypothetical protein
MITWTLILSITHGNQKYEYKIIYECKNENINLLDQCKGENVFLDMVIDIHNPLSSKLTNIHNSIRNEVFLKFNLNDYKLKHLLNS